MLAQVLGCPSCWMGATWAWHWPSCRRHGTLFCQAAWRLALWHSKWHQALKYRHCSRTSVRGTPGLFFFSLVFSFAKSLTENGCLFNLTFRISLLPHIQCLETQSKSMEFNGMNMLRVAHFPPCLCTCIYLSQTLDPAQLVVRGRSHLSLCRYVPMIWVIHARQGRPFSILLRGATPQVTCTSTWDMWDQRDMWDQWNIARHCETSQTCENVRHVRRIEKVNDSGWKW